MEPRACWVSLGWRCQPESHSSRPPAENGVSAAARGDPNLMAANGLIPKFCSMLVAGLEGCFAHSCPLKQRSCPGCAQTRVGAEPPAPHPAACAQPGGIPGGATNPTPRTHHHPRHPPCRKAPPWGSPPAHPQSSPTTPATPAHRPATVATVPVAEARPPPRGLPRCRLPLVATAAVGCREHRWSQTVLAARWLLPCCRERGRQPQGFVPGAAAAPAGRPPHALSGEPRRGWGGGGVCVCVWCFALHPGDCFILFFFLVFALFFFFFFFN